MILLIGLEKAFGKIQYPQVTLKTQGRNEKKKLTKLAKEHLKNTCI